jgi:hypothetical protein
MNSRIEDKLDRTDAYVQSLGSEVASVVSGLSPAAIAARMRRRESVRKAEEADEHRETEVSTPVPESIEPVVQEESVAMVEPDATAPAADKPISDRTSTTSNEKISMTEDNYALKLVMGGTSIEIGNEVASILPRSFLLMFQAALKEDFDEVVVLVGADPAKAAEILMSAGRDTIEGMMADKKMAVTLEGLVFRTGSAIVLGEFLKSYGRTGR